MSPLWVIAIVTLAMYIAHRLTLARYHKTRDESWLRAALLFMLLDAEARKARDRALDKERDS